MVAIVAYINAYCAIIYTYVDMYAELSFKTHNIMQADEGPSLYETVQENKSTGRGEKTEFKELEVNSCIIIMVCMYIVWGNERFK